MDKLVLMNSAIMPKPGRYTCKKVNTAYARGLYRECKMRGDEIDSSIGYPQAARILGGLVGDEIEISRKQTEFDEKDTILAMRLRYRVDPAEKGDRKHGGQLEDYDFFVISWEPL